MDNKMDIVDTLWWNIFYWLKMIDYTESILIRAFL